MKNLFWRIITPILIVLILLEIGFRIAVFIKVEVLKPSFKKTEGIFTILCVGDSTTEGLTVSKEYSYPSRLQELLDQYSSDKKYRVINLGYAGVNSSQILNRFEDNIKRYHPDLIVLLAGINDPWNMNESRLWMFDASSSLWDKIKLRADVFLSYLRVYQFIKLITLDTKDFQKEAHVDHLDLKREGFAVSFEHSPDKKNQLYQLLLYNIGHMVELAKSHGVPIFVQTFQKEGLGQPRVLINKVYEKMHVPIVDNQRVFELGEKKGLKLISYDDYHPNKDGYVLIAKNVFNMMIQQKMLNAPPLPLIED
jgi:lysophospholipase L1-like esterase